MSGPATRGIRHFVELLERLDVAAAEGPATLIQAALDACDGNVPRAAVLLEISPSTIYRKLQTWQDGEAAGG